MWFVGTFVKLQKVTISSVMSVCPSIAHMEQLIFFCTDFDEM
jgi:hypothetical protein